MSDLQSSSGVLNDVQFRTLILALYKDSKRTEKEDGPLAADLVINNIANIYNQGFPIVLLPNELLAEIFYMSLQTESHSSPSADRATYHPVHLSHVNRRFREVALTTPTIWTSALWSSEKSVDGLAAYLQRSSPMPFSVTIKCTLDSPGIDMHNVWLPHIERCTAIYVEGPKLSAADWIIGSLSNLCAPHVKCLSIDVWNAGTSLDATPEFRPNRDIFKGGSPSLSHLRLSGVSTASCWPSPLTITSLTITPSLLPKGHPNLDREKFTLVGLCNVLAQMTSLHHLNLSIFQLEVNETVVGPTTLPSLRYLDLDGLLPPQDYDAIYFYSRVANAIHAPYLTALTLRNMELEEVDIIFSMHPYPNLRFCRFIDAVVCFGATLASLSRYSQIEHFSIHGKCHNDRFLDFLIPERLNSFSHQFSQPPQLEPLWPRLKSLAIDSCDLETLVEALECFVETNPGVSRQLFLSDDLHSNLHQDERNCQSLENLMISFKSCEDAEGFEYVWRMLAGCP